MTDQRILLVEGQGDRNFFRHFICHLEFEVKIEPETPRNSCQSNRDGIDVLRIRTLPTALNRLKNGSISHLGVVIDADSFGHNNGFSTRRQQFTGLLREAGYNIPESTPDELTGELFSHPDDHPSIGLWIMPTHHSDGMLEDLLLDNVSQEQQVQLLAGTDQTIGDLGELQLFKDTHLSKARLATLLAWQQKPGTSAGKSYQTGTYNTQANAFTALTNWLNRVFLDHDKH